MLFDHTSVRQPPGLAGEKQKHILKMGWRAGTKNMNIGLSRTGGRTKQHILKMGLPWSGRLKNTNIRKGHMLKMGLARSAGLKNDRPKNRANLENGLAQVWRAREGQI